MDSLWRERRDELFRAEGLPFAAAQRIVAGKRFEDGEIFVKMVKTSPLDPVWFELVEADRVRTPLDASPADPQGSIRAGVEKDRNGIRVAYWVSKNHPGDTTLHNTTGNKPFAIPLGSEDFDRVPAEMVWHSRRQSRPGQSRGEPVMHAVLQDIHDLDLLLLASLKRVQISACLAVFLKSPASMPQMLDVTAEKYGYQLDTDIEPGMIFKLQPGEEIETLVPNFPVPGLESFVFMLARRIGAALGLSWQTVLNDWSQSNYSSARTQILEERLVWAIEQNELIDCLRWIWEQVHLDAALRGDSRSRGVSVEDIRSVQAITPAKPWIDPQKEAAATQLKLEMGLTTLQREAACLGEDWEELLMQRLLEEKREKEMREELGLGPKQKADKPELEVGEDAGEDEDEDEDEERLAA